LFEFGGGFEEGDHLGLFLELFFALSVGDERLLIVLEKGVAAGVCEDADVCEVEEELDGVWSWSKAVNKLFADLLDGGGGFGVAEAVVIADDQVAYLKIDRQTLDEEALNELAAAHA